VKNRYTAVWFPYFKTDVLSRKDTSKKMYPYVLYVRDRGRMVISAINEKAQSLKISKGMLLADARAICSQLNADPDDPPLFQARLNKMAEWFIRYSPIVVADQPDTIIINASGCCHLWGGETSYLKHIWQRMNAEQYQVKIAIADSTLAAKAITLHGHSLSVVPANQTEQVVQSLPLSALGLSEEIVLKLHEWGFRTIGSITAIPAGILSRRLGPTIKIQLDKMFGAREEFVKPVQETVTWIERLPCLEPISHLAGIQIAIDRLITGLIGQLKRKGLAAQKIILKSYRLDGKIGIVSESFSLPTIDIVHMRKILFLKLEKISPGPGIELFSLEATEVAPYQPVQLSFWQTESEDLKDKKLLQFLDSVTANIGTDCLSRFLPAAHHWPERSFRKATHFNDESKLCWQTSLQRPVYLLKTPALIQVTAPVPDYPPMLFRYKNKLHKIIKADGPERIEQEWWINEGLHRDYYFVEDDAGCRYWLFRSGHYTEDRKEKWYLHGFFP
jgi:protein ImuB